MNYDTKAPHKSPLSLPHDNQVIAKTAAFTHAATPESYLAVGTAFASAANTALARALHCFEVR